MKIQIKNFEDLQAGDTLYGLFNNAPSGELYVPQKEEELCVFGMPLKDLFDLGFTFKKAEREVKDLPAEQGFFLGEDGFLFSTNINKIWVDVRTGERFQPLDCIDDYKTIQSHASYKQLVYKTA